MPNWGERGCLCPTLRLSMRYPHLSREKRYTHNTTSLQTAYVRVYYGPPWCQILFFIPCRDLVSSTLNIAVSPQVHPRSARGPPVKVNILPYLAVPYSSQTTYLPTYTVNITKKADQLNCPLAHPVIKGRRQTSNSPSRTCRLAQNCHHTHKVILWCISKTLDSGVLAHLEIHLRHERSPPFPRLACLGYLHTYLGSRLL